MTENEIAKILVNIFLSAGSCGLESVYEAAICYELDKLGIKYKRKQGIAVVYDDAKMDIGFRADIIVENKVIVEIKSIEAIAPVHQKTLLTYIKLTDLKLGLLVNSPAWSPAYQQGRADRNVNLIKEGITRIVNNL